MFFINNVLMRPDNVTESVDLLEDNIVRDVTRPFPNLDVLPEGDRIATTFAIACHIVDKTDIDYGSDKFRDKDRFEIIVSLVGKALAKELNEKAPIEMVQFASMFKSLMMEKFAFLYTKRSIVVSFTYQNDTTDTLPLSVSKLIKENPVKVLSAINAIKNS